MSRTWELVAAPLRAMRRAAIWWAVGLVGLIAATVAFWPAFRGSSGITDAINQLPSAVIDAFGLANFGTPAGYLRGNLYELFVPLLFAMAAITLANGQTAGEEASGRLELFFAQPVSRRAILLGRAVAVLIVLVALAAVVAVAQVAADAAVDLQIDSGYLASTILLCALLGILHGSLAIAIAGARATPSLVMGIGIAITFAGYIVSALFPLSAVISPWQHVSPWNWALGGDPLVNPTELWRYAALAVPSVLLTAFGLGAISRRDIQSA